MGEVKKKKRIVRRVTLNDGTKKDVYARSKTELNEKVKEIKRLDNEGVELSNNLTVGDWTLMWLKEYKSHLRGNTTVMYITIYSAHIEPYLGNILIKDVLPIDIKKVMNAADTYEWKNKKGEVTKTGQASESLLKKVLLTMNQIFQTAVENHKIPYNPCVGIKIAKRQKTDKIKTLDDNQQASLIVAAELTRAYIFIMLGIYCGLRREESLGLRWTDIDWGKERLKVRRTVTFYNNTATVENLTKSASGIRELPLPEPLLNALNSANREHKETGHTYVKTRVKGGWNVSDTVSIYLCPGSNGEVMTPSSYDRMWEVAAKRVDFHVTSHMLRHTYCTSLHKAGIDLRMAQYLMGDSDLKTVSSVYTHIENNQIEAADAKVKALYKNFSQQSVN